MKIWTDGNPEKCCIVIEGEMPRIFEFEESKVAPYCEWEAILRAVKMIQSRSEDIELINDNKVVIKQLNMEYEVNKEDVREYAEEIWELLNSYSGNIKFIWNSRSDNKAGKPLG